jgi:chromosome segregation ATPase
VDKFQALQVQCSGILKEKSALASKVEGLQAELAALSGSASSAAVSQAQLQGRIAELEAQVAELKASGAGDRGGLEAALARAQEQIASLARQLEEAQTEIEARIEKSKQFANVRQMMAKKNEVIAGLRRQLQDNGIAVAGDVAASD